MGSGKSGFPDVLGVRAWPKPLGLKICGVSDFRACGFRKHSGYVGEASELDGLFRLRGFRVRGFGVKGLGV